MNRPDQSEINKQGTEVERYIAKLENEIAIANDQLYHIRKIVGAGDDSNLFVVVQELVSNVLRIRKVESQQLDQFAAAALTGWLSGVNGEANIHAVSAYCYDQAESMLAESKKRQGRLL